MVQSSVGCNEGRNGQNRTTLSRLFQVTFLLPCESLDSHLDLRFLGNRRHIGRAPFVLWIFASSVNYAGNAGFDAIGPSHQCNETYGRETIVQSN